MTIETIAFGNYAWHAEVQLRLTIHIHSVSTLERVRLYTCVCVWAANVEWRFWLATNYFFCLKVVVFFLFQFAVCDWHESEATEKEH